MSLEGSLQRLSSGSHRIYLVAGDPKRYTEVKFIVNDRDYKAYLGSDAVRRYLKEKGEKEVKLTVFVPESFLVDKTLKEFEEDLRCIVDDFEAVAIPAIGTFGGKRFEGVVENIVTAIFLKLLEDRPERLYADITTGFNLYPVSLVDAVRRYLTYGKLSDILQGESEVKAFTIFYPVLGVETSTIEIQNLDVKVFFSLPKASINDLIKKEGLRKTLEFGKRIREINSRYEKVKKHDFGRLYSELKIAFNAIRFNVPLAFYEILEMNEAVDVVEGKVKAFIRELLDPLENTEKSLKRLPVDGVSVANVFYSLALYRSIQNFSRTLENAELDEIYERFNDLYRKRELGLGLYYYFLDRDVESVRDAVNRAIEKGKIEEGVEKPLIELKEFSGVDIASSKGHEKRNFFAHSGFIWNYTLVKKIGERIHVGWREDKKDEIKNWLKKPEK